MKPKRLRKPPKPRAKRTAEPEKWPPEHLRLPPLEVLEALSKPTQRTLSGTEAPR